MKGAGLISIVIVLAVVGYLQKTQMKKAKKTTSTMLQEEVGMVGEGDSKAANDLLKKKLNKLSRDRAKQLEAITQ